MSANTTNGRPARKQLADQLDRLDSVIETMGSGLNAAVADACREGTRAAVREVAVQGKLILEDGRHPHEEEIRTRYKAAQRLYTSQ